MTRIRPPLHATSVTLHYLLAVDCRLSTFRRYQNVREGRSASLLKDAVWIAVPRQNNAKAFALSPDPQKDMTMNIKYALCGVALAALVTPALAANEFYVVQDSATKKCSIVDQKPTAAALMLVGTTVYKTQAEAEIAMKADKICASQ